MPLKRDPSLIPLSHDHHHGLARVFEIRQALRAGAGLEREAQTMREFHRTDLAPHFTAEEAALFPAMRAADCGIELIAVLIEEHEAMRQMIEELDASVERLRAFADLLERHIRREERELFAEYQQHVGEATRREVGAEVRRLLDRPEDVAPACDLPPR